MTLLTGTVRPCYPCSSFTLPAFTPWEPPFALSRQERLSLVFSAIDRCGADCPACAIWELEQDMWQAALD